MACRGVPCSNSHSCTQLCSSVRSFLALCLSRFTLQLSHLSLSVTLFFFFLYSALSLLHLCLIFTLCPSCPALSFLALFLLSFFFSHSSTLSLCPPSLFASHKSIFVFFSVSSTLSLPSCCQWGHSAGEGTLRSLLATNLTLWEEVWQRTCALTRLIPRCFTVQSSRQREQPKVKHSRWM